MSKYYYRAGVKFVFAKGAIYCNEPMFLDIETSNNHAEDPAELRSWIVSIQVLFHNEYHLFRYPEELISWMKKLYYKLGLKPSEKFKKKLIIYIHNLSYDMSYLYPYLLQLPGVDPEDEYQGIIEAPNKFLSLVFGSFEFLCSYRLSGMSLEKWSKEMNAEQGQGWPEALREQRTELGPELPSLDLGPSGPPARPRAALPGPFLLAEAVGDGRHGGPWVGG